MKDKKYLSAVMLLTVLILSICSGCERRQAMEIYEETEVSLTTEAALPETAESVLFVDVRGAVLTPGVYELSAGSRVFAAIEAAGGLLPDAEERAVNQAALLSDGQQLYIPVKGEADFSEALVQSGDDRVDINTADETELTTLPGIGSSRAADIIAYREAKGGFSSIEEIMQVSGIKDALFQKIKDKIKV